MRKEEKELLIKDLCGRLPYAVHIEHTTSGVIGALHDMKVYPCYKGDDIDDYICVIDLFGDQDYIDIEHIKPYLFPLSSMTEEQKEEYQGIVDYISAVDTDNWAEGEFVYVNRYIDRRNNFEKLLHFYNKHHLDYRGLIPKGLAIDATEKNIY